MKVFLLIIFFIGTIFFFFQTKENSPQEEARIQVVFKSVTVRAEIADTNESRILGLSGHEPLGEREGMWFDFKTSGIHGIWMKEMNFPIDILWFDESFRIIHIKENAEPSSYPEVFASPSPARYVLEAPAGFVKKYGVLRGDVVTVQNPS